MSLYSALFSEVGLPALLEQFGEALTFFPGPGGPAATITAVVIRDQDDRRRRQHVETNTETIEIIVADDPAGDFGGIAQPVRRDRLVLDGDTEPQAFAWTGKADRGTGFWLLEYTRPKQKTLGTMHRPEN